jgi:pterin-4a-carbinolamine dehydratase
MAASSRLLDLMDVPEPAAIELGLDGHPHVIYLPPELAQAIAAQEDWWREHATLGRDFAFKDFDEAWEFAGMIAEHAIDHWRRPAMTISQGQVRLRIRNPNNAGLTLAELRLAAKVNAVLDSVQPATPGRY